MSAKARMSTDALRGYVCSSPAKRPGSLGIVRSQCQTQEDGLSASNCSLIDLDFVSENGLIT
jgi:hypothetical protein